MTNHRWWRFGHPDSTSSSRTSSLLPLHGGFHRDNTLRWPSQGNSSLKASNSMVEPSSGSAFLKISPFYRLLGIMGVDVFVKLLPRQPIWTPAGALARLRPHLNREGSHSFQVRVARGQTKAETDAAQALFNGPRVERWELCFRRASSRHGTTLGHGWGQRCHLVADVVKSV